HNGQGVSRYLAALRPEFISRSAHFLENHDEPRIASLLSPAEHRAAALLVLSLPGMRLLHEGQLFGAQQRVSIHVDHCPPDRPQPEIAAFYELLLTILPTTAVGRGRGSLLQPLPAWRDNPTASTFVIIQWQ